VPRSIPACHLRLFAEQAATYGTVKLTREKFATVLRMAEDEIASRQVLRQIATSGASNSDIVRMAVGALKHRPVLPPPGRSEVALSMS
jgi:hypothetical protein